jgi:hypothetical protein
MATEALRLSLLSDRLEFQADRKGLTIPSKLLAPKLEHYDRQRRTLFVSPFSTTSIGRRRS